MKELNFKTALMMVIGSFLLLQLSVGLYFLFGTIKVVAGAAMTFFVCLLIFIVGAIAEVKHKTGSFLSGIKINHLINKVIKERNSNVDEDRIARLFTLTSKEIMIGERIINSFGGANKKISEIKDTVNRCAAQLQLDVSFAINIDDGKAYKVIKFNFEENKSYYEISYSELNRCLEMNEKTWTKYKKFTNENWKTLIEKA